MSTLKEVAEQAGVSTFTVSRVLSGRGRESRISHARIEAVQEVAKKLGYRPNAAARATRERRTRQVGVLVYNHPGRPDFVPQNQLILQGINYELQNFGYLMVLVRLTDLGQDNDITHRAYVEQCLDGIGAVNVLPPNVEETLEDHFSHCVWIDCNMNRDGRSLRRDEQLAGRLPVEHAVRVGYSRVVYLHFDDDHDDSLHGVKHYSTAGRHQGAQEAAEELGIEFVSKNCGREWDAQAFQGVTDYFTPDTMVLAYNLGLLRISLRLAMEDRKLVGKDFGLACCESTPELEIDWPEICHSTFDRFLMGTRGARILLDQIESARDKKPAKKPDLGEVKLLTPEFVEGSTAPGPSSAKGAKKRKGKK